MRPQLVAEEILLGSRIAGISVKRAPFLQLVVEILESWQVLVCLAVIRLREAGQAAEERHPAAATAIKKIQLAASDWKENERTITASRLPRPPNTPTGNARAVVSCSFRCSSKS